MNKSTLVNQLPSNMPGNMKLDDEESMIREALMELQEEEHNIEENKVEVRDDNMNRQNINEIEEYDEKFEENYEEDVNTNLIEDQKNNPINLMKPLIGELQYTIYVVMIFFVLSVIPVEKIVYKYISLNRIPYSDIILKSILAGLLFFVLTKL